jgi:hypothetical protein
MSHILSYEDNKFHAGHNCYRLKVDSFLLILVIVLSLFAILVYLQQQSYQLIPSTRHFFDPNTGKMTTLDNRHSAAVANFHFNRNLQVCCLARPFYYF